VLEHISKFLLQIVQVAVNRGKCKYFSRHGDEGSPPLLFQFDLTLMGRKWGFARCEEGTEERGWFAKGMNSLSQRRNNSV
jgi:hypothetical protein